MNTYTSRKQNLMIGRVLKIYLIKTQNMFKFDLKHGYYHINKLVPRRSWKIGKVGYFALTVFASQTWLSPVPVRKDYSSFSKLPVQKAVKDSMFLGWVSEFIRTVIWSNSQFKFSKKNFAKSEFVVNFEKLIWQTQEVMTEFRIV